MSTHIDHRPPQPTSTTGTYPIDWDSQPIGHGTIEHPPGTVIGIERVNGTWAARVDVTDARSGAIRSRVAIISQSMPEPAGDWRWLGTADMRPLGMWHALLSVPSTTHGG